VIGGLGIQVLGATETAKKISDLPVKLHLAEIRAVNVGRIKAERVFRRKVSGEVLKVRTGAYRASITSGAPEDVQGRIEAKVGVRRGPASRYAGVHETGAVIVPKRAKALVFQLPDGRWVRTQKVVIPARRPLGKTFDEVQPEVLEKFREEVSRVTKSAG
jgi:phage gpG-like protein